MSGHKIEGYIGESWLNPREREAVLRLLPDGGAMLEIGTADGVTAAWVADHKPMAVVLSLDTFPAADSGVTGELGSYEKWRKNAHQNQALYVGTATQLARLMPFAVFDLSLVDGEHTYEACLADLRAAGVLTRPEGYICMHDFGRPKNGVKAAFESWNVPWQIVNAVGSMVILRRTEDEELNEKLRSLGYA